MRLLFAFLMIFNYLVVAGVASPSRISELACEALELGELLEFNYHGERRLIEVHVVGETKKGIALVRAWQVDCAEVDIDGEPQFWRSFHPSEMQDAMVQDVTSQAPRPGYNPIDPAIFEVECKV